MSAVSIIGLIIIIIALIGREYIDWDFAEWYDYIAEICLVTLLAIGIYIYGIGVAVG